MDDLKVAIQQLEDLDALVNTYLTQGGYILLEASQSMDKKGVEQAEQYFKEGLSCLNDMDLVPIVKRDIHLMRNAFKYAIKATNALRNGKYSKAERQMRKSQSYSLDYARVISKGVI